MDQMEIINALKSVLALFLGEPESLTCKDVEVFSFEISKLVNYLDAPILLTQEMSQTWLRTCLPITADPLKYDNLELFLQNLCQPLHSFPEKSELYYSIKRVIWSGTTMSKDQKNILDKLCEILEI